MKSWKDELLSLKAERPYYDVSKVRAGRDGFVLWIDVLGTKEAMVGSMARAQNFVMKLHVAFLESRRSNGPHYFPMNDGAFVVHQSCDAVCSLAIVALRRLAITFALEPNPAHRFMVRGGIAHGACLFGADMAGRNHNLNTKHGRFYSKRIVLGAPLAAAHTAESTAPPFGIRVDSSAAKSGLPVTEDALWPWYTDGRVEPAVRVGLRARLDEHLGGAKYDKAPAHRAAAAAMLGDCAA